jgi:hypothetical protein
MTAVPMTAVAVGTTSGWFALESGRATTATTTYDNERPRYVYSELHPRVAVPNVGSDESRRMRARLEVRHIRREWRAGPQIACATIDEPRNSGPNCDGWDVKGLDTMGRDEIRSAGDRIFETHIEIGLAEQRGESRALLQRVERWVRRQHVATSSCTNATTAPRYVDGPCESAAGLCALSTNVVGMSRARATEYHRAGS